MNYTYETFETAIIQYCSKRQINLSAREDLITVELVI